MAFYGQCPGSLTLTTQEEIDDFNENYPDCAGAGLLLTINGQNSNVTNLNGLSQLTSLSYLGIFFTQVTDFSGMDNLTSVTTNFRILGNQEITNLSGFDSLTEIGDSVRLVINTNLESLEGLQSLTTVIGSFEIEGNSALESLTGLDNLASIGGSLEIKSHQNLTNLVGLSGLETVGTITLDTFNLFNNTGLESLEGLESLTQINGIFELRNNTSLTSLEGLSNLESVTAEISIRSNDALSYCAVAFVCDHLGNPNIDFLFDDNALGCSSLAEVEASCLLLDNNNIGLENEIVLFPNPVSEFIQIQTSETLGIIKATLYSSTGKTLLVSSEAAMDISTLATGIYFVEVQTEYGKVTKKIVKE